MTERQQVNSLLGELREAFRRPLFEEIVLFESKLRASINPSQSQPQTQLPRSLPATDVETASQASSVGRVSSSRGKRLRSENIDSRNKRTWQELLSDAACLSPYFTEEEYGQVLRYACLFVLGFLLPLSTGNEFVLLQHQNTSLGTNKDVSIVDYLFQISLDERLEQSIAFYSANEYGEQNLSDPSVELAFHALIQQGLAPLLASRPVVQPDLLHILAMAIDPQPCADVILKETVRYLEVRNSALWKQTKQLLENPAALHFQIGYEQRVLLTQVVAEHLVVPAMDDDDGLSPLFGALTHLRASLRAMARGAQSGEDAQLARCALVSLACQSRNRHVLQDEWDYQVHGMVDDKTDYNCCHSGDGGSMRNLRLQALVEEATRSSSSSYRFCPHWARGRLLAVFLLQCCQSPKDADVLFLKHALGSLADAIEWQVDCWTVIPDDDEAMEPAELHAPCLLASLLLAAQPCFYFVSKNKTLDADDDHVESLIQSAILLLNHSNLDIVQEAANLLMAAFSHFPLSAFDKHASKLFETLKGLLEKDIDSSLVENVIAVACQRSTAFASSMYSFLLNVCINTNRKHSVFRLVASVASNSPSVVAKESERLISLLDQHATTSDGLDLMASLLSSRQARYFARANDPMVLAVRRGLDQQTDRWGLYQLAFHALVTGNFGIAANVYSKLLETPLNEKHYLWMSLLQKVSQAESSLSDHARKGIPSASVLLRTALALLQSLAALDGDSKHGYTFQIRFILLRLDFLDLITILSQLTREMRLGSSPVKHTRAHLHLQNVVKSFAILSSRYRLLYQQYGMQFQYAQSRESLRALEGLCLFVEQATRAVFSDVLPSQSNPVSNTDSKSLDQPMMRLVRRLDKLVVQPMHGVLDPLVRAAAMLEVIDGILMAPFPFPRDFVAPRVTVLATLRLTSDPEEVQEFGTDELHVVEAYPSICFSFYASGSIPRSLSKESKLPFSTLLLWYRLVYERPLSEYDAPVDDKQEDDGVPSVSRDDVSKRMPDLSSFSPVVSRISSDGSFFIPIECPPLMEEGLYTIEVKLGCRDVAGGEWELFVDESSRTLPVRVSRSR